MQNTDLQKVINIILYNKLPNLSDTGLQELDDYVKDGIESYLSDLRHDDTEKLTRIRVALDMISNFEYQEERKDEDTEEYRCIVCEEVTNNYGDCKSNMGTIRMGFGSKHDTDLVELTLCDKCLTEKKEKNVVKVEELKW